MSKPGCLHGNGLLLTGTDGKMVCSLFIFLVDAAFLRFPSSSFQVNVQKLMMADGKMINASKFGEKEEVKESLVLSDDERKVVDETRVIWKGILSVDILDATDFFKAGAGSMDVARLVEEVREKCNGVFLQNEDVYMCSDFASFSRLIIAKSRGEINDKELEFDSISMHVNNMDVSFPHQLFINNEFVTSSHGKVLRLVNPNDESVSSVHAAC